MLDSCQNYSKIKNIKEKIKSTSNDDGENLEYGDSDGYELEGDASSSFSGRNLSLKKLAFLKDPLGKGVDNFNSSHLNELFECCITHLSAELGRIRTGRATPALNAVDPPFVVHVKDPITLLVPIPKLDDTSKAILSKQASAIGERCKMKIRTCRRTALSSCDFVSKEEIKRLEKDIQKAHDKFIEKIDKLVMQKKNEIKLA
ncbi:ribosome-recycling factor [Mitosporidium daphniae]|uniref:Ribosome-recycling factor n=1 Tax=Mitosporidium daphniae TaxID=1485682 RepID=A0A098VPL7_9MICR|nr:ribosome-recycling factor [Mitosporidium daphniae]KGG50870.1 ribosome-recycling factor [Mitosporidium daphniae]|eukprot:XP_013237297.1 ribosome-recycling factor [Mitosporidium daphniae]